MLANQDVSRIADEVAKAKLPAGEIERVFVEPTWDSEGNDALKVTIVVPPGSVEHFGGDALLDTLVELQNRLFKAGEQRFAIVEYATQEEIERGDTEC